MQKFLRCLLFAALPAGMASTTLAGELTVTMSDGRVTVIAQDVPVSQILAEWARVGDTKMVNAEKVTGGPITLQLVDVPEKEALDILLRSAAGYVTAPRPVGNAGASLYDRVIILATSKAPVSAPVSAPPTPFNRANRAVLAPPVPIRQPPPEDDDVDPAQQPPNEHPGVQAPGMPFPGPAPAVPQGQVPPPNQGPLTSPRPGPLPQPPQPNPANPYVRIGPDGRPIPVAVPIPGGRGGQ